MNSNSNLVGKSVKMVKPTATTTKNKKYKVLGVNYAGSPYCEIRITNDNGRPIIILRKRVRAL